MTVICAHLLAHSLSFFFDGHPVKITRVEKNTYHRMVYEGKDSNKNYYLVRDLSTGKEVMDHPKCEERR